MKAKLSCSYRIMASNSQLGTLTSYSCTWCSRIASWAARRSVRRCFIFSTSLTQLDFLLRNTTNTTTFSILNSTCMIFFQSALHNLIATLTTYLTGNHRHRLCGAKSAPWLPTPLVVPINIFTRALDNLMNAKCLIVCNVGSFSKTYHLLTEFE